MKNKDTIDQLLKEQETISNKALKNALQRQIEEESKAQEELLLKQFKAAKDNLNRKIEDLRHIRACEKQAKNNVLKASNAFEEFKKDGDWDKFYKNC